SARARRSRRGRDPASRDHRAREGRRFRRHRAAPQSGEAAVDPWAVPRGRVRIHRLHRFRGRGRARRGGGGAATRDPARDSHRSARTFFAMGREGGLPRVFAWTHPRFRSPWVGIALALVITFVLDLILGRHWNHPAPNPFTYVQFMALTATLGILAVYILVALSGMLFFWRARSEQNVGYNVVLDVVLPIGAI